MKLQCINCEKIADATGEFWTLRGYYKLNGVYCSDCYSKVSHDGDGNPKNPTEYLMILLRQEKGNDKKA